MVHDAGTRPIRRGLAMEAASLLTTISDRAAEPRLAAYHQWLSSRPELTDDVIRRGWTPLLGEPPDTDDTVRDL
jgi:hypothetical protein